MTNIFDGSKYQEAAAKCVAFIKRQMNVNNFTHKITFGQEYSDYYSGDVLWGKVEGFTGEEDQVGNCRSLCPRRNCSIR